ncbi:Transient receptor potential cation channel subfamily M member 8 [Echinococcus granulosus]|nr:Transient receptor potential cation channel subfamily M member 8 [Echinococcus granulosus]
MLQTKITPFKTLLFSTLANTLQSQASITSQEGINVIHVAAAVGDYLALRMLLQCKDAPISNVDKSKRTALHYAAQTNIETVIILLTHSKGLLKCTDIDDLTPLQFIQHEQRGSMHHFLEFHTELYNAGERDAQKLNSGDKKAVNLRRLIEAPLILDSYVCTILPMRQDSICECCNTRGYNHEKLSVNAEFMKVIASRESGFVRRPTNTFGQFEKAFSPIVSQGTKEIWVKCASACRNIYPERSICTDDKDVTKLSNEKDPLERLGALSNKTWILTDGKEKGVGDVISKAVRGYAEAYGMQQLQVIGLVPWRRLYNSHLLRCNDYLDTGGLAKALEIFVNFMKHLLQGESHGSFYPRWSNCKYNLDSLIERAKGVMEFESSDGPHIRDILDRAYLLEFITTTSEGAHEMDARILQSLIKPELFEGIDEEESWDFKIGIALSLNRTDFLPENMFTRVHWKGKKGMKEVLTKCLVGNNTNFIRLLVDSGFPLHEYIDESLLVKLYKADFDSNVPQLINWSQIDHLISGIIGFEIGNQIRAKRSRSPTSYSIDEIWSETDMPEESKNGEESLLQLLIWSFLSRRFELSHLIWTLMKDSIPAALILAFVARRMRSQQQSLRERPLYGNLSQLLLAEESHSVHFVEHQACQTCVENMWNQNLSANTQPVSYLVSLLAGVILPPLVPLLAEYDYSSYKHFERQDDVQGNAMEKNSSKATYKRRIVDFYRAPCVRFAYSAFCSVLLLILYSAVLLTVRSDSIIHPWEIILHVSLGLTMFQHVCNAIKTHKSVKQYFGNTRNRLLLLTLFFYVSGNLHYLDSRIKGFGVLAGLARLSLSSCLLCACAFILHFLVLSRYIGPKLMMIITMVKCDMLPFLAIIGVFWLTFSLFTVAMIYRPHGPENMGQHVHEILHLARNNFFSMFGEFDIADNVADIAKEEEECTRFGECTYAGAQYIYPIIMIVYVLLTHVLLINLLIAMFTERYDKMEYMSKQLWAMQKFGLVKSFANAPPLPFPYVVIWPFISVFHLCYRLFQHQPTDDTPFCFEVDETRQGQIINWAKFRSLDYHHRHSNAFQWLKTQARQGKLHKKMWWSGIEGKEYQELQITTIGTRLATELIERRLQAIEMRLSAAAAGALNDQKATSGPSIAVLEEDGKIVSRSQSKWFDSIHMSKFTDPEVEIKEVCNFTYDRHTVAYFSNPQDDIMPRSLTRFVPWTEELLNYEPKVLDCVERILPDWSEEEMKERMSKPKASDTVLRNPTGRTGIAGRGILPVFGANPAVVVVLISEEKLYNHGSEVKEEVLRRVLLRGCPRRKYQLPWFLCKHTAECNQLECMQSLMIAYMHAMAKEASKFNSNQSLTYRLIIEELDKCPVRLCHMGELEDWINSDNAWIDVTAINVRIPSTFQFWELIPQIFSTPASKARWEEMSKLPLIKNSHFSCLAYFQEAFIRHQAQR